MELQHLRTFLAVAEAQSLTRAAEQLHLSQPAVSAHVKSLEDELGLTLFRRTGRGMALTAAGDDLLTQAHDIITRADTLTRRAKQLSGEASGVLRLGLIDCGRDLLLARTVGQTRRQHPALTVELATHVSAENIDGVLDQSLDVAYAEGEWDEPRLRFWRLSTSRVGIIAPIAWREQLAEGGWPRLAEFPWLFQGAGCSYCRLLDRLCREHRVRFTPDFRAEAYGAVSDLVAEGLALSVADLDAVQPLIDEGRVFAWGGFEYAMPISLIALQQRTAEPLIRSFAESAVAAHRPATRRKARPVAEPEVAAGEA